VTIGDRMGFIDRKGSVSIKAVYGRVRGASEGLAAVQFAAEIRGASR
jgi:hypothetical protein